MSTGPRDVQPRQDRPVGTAGVGNALVATAVTALFVPGNRPERFSKAAASGAHVVIIDLEDAVEPAAKPTALAAVLEALRPHAAHPLRALVRVNAADSPTYPTEIRTLHDLSKQPGHGLLGLVVPKAEDPRHIAEVATQFTTGDHPIALVPLVESALGVVNVLELARVPGVTRLAVGAVDLALDLDAEGDSPVLGYSRAQVVLASRAAGIAAPLDSPSIEITDLQAVEHSARTGRGFGFSGKLCIHPAQLRPIAAAFLPTEEQISWARSVVSAGDAAVQLDGQMIDKPVIEKARRILHRAVKVSA